MALPKSSETPRGKYLKEILSGETAEALIEWPMPAGVLHGCTLVLA
jgi:hypothetical protein